VSGGNHLFVALSLLLLHELNVPRTTVAQLRQSRFPSALGLCSTDTTSFYQYVNEATQRLINAASENGWWGGWARVVFEVEREDPYITLPTEFARMIAADVCRFPIRIQNSWFEYLEAGIGLQRPCDGDGWGCNAATEGYDRLTVPTAYDLDPENQYIRVYYTDSRDIGKAINFIGAEDQNGNGIYTTVGTTELDGFQMTLAAPFATTNFIVTSFTGVQKQQTYGDVTVYQVDATTGEESLLARYKPNDINPSYRRYLLKGLPLNCCASSSANDSRTVQVSAMCKYEYFPVQSDNDFLLVGNIPAMIEEAQSIRYDGMDSPDAFQKSAIKHANAIKLLQQELQHYEGKIQPAIVVAPFGTAYLGNQQIGTMV
jgi:hypothetical protein